MVYYELVVKQHGSYEIQAELDGINSGIFFIPKIG